jgi:hypothetical protein
LTRLVKMVKSLALGLVVRLFAGMLQPLVVIGVAAAATNGASVRGAAPITTNVATVIRILVNIAFPFLCIFQVCVVSCLWRC